MSLFGIVGKNISYSLSPEIYQKLASESNVLIDYKIFDVNNHDDVVKLITDYEGLVGFNVTIPFKKSILEILDNISPEVAEIGATNCVVVDDEKKLYGYNTDWLAFKNTFSKIKKDFHYKALVLGSGGAAAAIVYALKLLNVDYLIVSQSAKNNNMLNNDKIITYKDLMAVDFADYNIVINATPCGTKGKEDSLNDIFPFDNIKENSLFYDLVYNPSITSFLQEGIKRNCITENGQKMLEQQAEIAWNKYFLPAIK
ncbi:shikimate dehydrogenase [Bacteroidales bacterium OttesenSCG-928-K03]|nr:shikimate dehydrogenase [Odoribacter sp. OttesenSCG-928-L07]MDL2242636.1 shikimate dehydrogenase [Bacteroidales bacterium OttesenSCG-928-K03]